MFNNILKWLRQQASNVIDALGHVFTVEAQEAVTTLDDMVRKYSATALTYVQEAAKSDLSSDEKRSQVWTQLAQHLEAEGHDTDPQERAACEARPARQSRLLRTRCRRRLEGELARRVADEVREPEARRGYRHHRARTRAARAFRSGSFLSKARSGAKSRMIALAAGLRCRNHTSEGSSRLPRRSLEA